MPTFNRASRTYFRISKFQYAVSTWSALLTENKKSATHWKEKTTHMNDLSLIDVNCKEVCAEF